MLNKIYRKLRFWQLHSRWNREESGREEDGEPEFSQDLMENLNVLKSIIKNSSDVVVRRFSLGDKKRTPAVIMFLNGMVDKTLVYETVLKPLMLVPPSFRDTEKPERGQMLARVADRLLFVGEVEEDGSVRSAVEGFLSGDTLLLIDGEKGVLRIDLRGWKDRAVEEPKTESTVRGPREGFTETLHVNTALLRRRIKSPDLVLETVKVGARTKTDVCIAYLSELADPRLIEEVKRRLGRIKTDAVLESGYLEEFIEDAPYSIFSTIANSEKPDKVAAKLLEGRAAILVDGTPFALTVPMLFVESFQASEDYYSRPVFASVVRLMRFVAYLISILAPALYVALTTFHQELIPTPLLLTMAAAREGIPFPAALEAAVMIAAFEILREAGVRLPRPVGQAISIVGALVIGESAVAAGLIGAPMVIIVSITAVSSFVVPPQIDSATVLRYVLLVLAGVMGGYGIAIGLFTVFIHLASLRSFGTPYLYSLAPFDAQAMKDSLIRVPAWAQGSRPAGMAKRDEVRQADNQKPGPPKAEGGGPGTQPKN